MLQVNFYPESDKEEYIKAAKEYTAIWQELGKKIVKTLEKHSRLTFSTKVINAVIFDGISFSTPLRLESKLTKNQKIAALAHELSHRLEMDNNYWFTEFPNREKLDEEIHKSLYLFLYDVWIDLLGENEAEKNKKLEISYNHAPHVNAWKWAMSFTKEERKQKFEEMKKKYQKR